MLCTFEYDLLRMERISHKTLSLASGKRRHLQVGEVTQVELEAVERGDVGWELRIDVLCPNRRGPGETVGLEELGGTTLPEHLSSLFQHRLFQVPALAVPMQAHRVTHPSRHAP